ncbi:MAG TPA: porin [Noviherbaspirillum sp.]|nr:porin [Noviherbaspirillum sp.]
MKKSIIALAVLGTLAGTAFAQTNITIYGVVDAGVVYDNSGNRNWKLDSGNQSGSRIGFKGTEDLGSGLSAIFNLENGFTTDDGRQANGGRLFGRQAWVGLKGGFGSVKMGRQLSPLYVAMDQIDPFRIGLAGNAQRAFGYGLYNADPFLRIDNTLSYSMPDVSGLTGTLSYGFGEQPGAFASNRTYAAGLGYANGPINAQLAYQKSTGVTVPGAIATAGSPAAVFGATPDLRTILIGGYYDFGVAKAHLAYGDTHADSPGTSLKTRNWLVGVSAPLGGAGTVMASWNRNNIRDIANGKSDQWAVGYSHALSKRTNLYTSIGYTKNDNGVSLNSTAPGNSDRLFNVGVRHLF